jgi:hypothetical protein
MTVVRRLAELGAGTAGAGPAPPSLPARRLLPLVATAALMVIGMLSTTWWGPALAGKTAWALPDDLWGTLAAADRLLHLHLAGLYTQPTGLITLPGAVIILLPVVAVSVAAGLSLAVQTAHNPQPVVWLLAGPYQIAVSCITLFAADAIAERLGVSWYRRAALAAAEALALWSVSVRWGHPEDAMAVGLFCYAILALARARPYRAGWLAGAAIAIQPLVLLALPVLAMAIAPRRLPGFLARAAAPAAVALGAAAAANWDATYTAVTRQPNFPAINHATPWAALSPQMAGGAVAAGPARIVAIVVACGCAVAAGRRWRAARAAGLDAARPADPDAARPADPDAARAAGWDGRTLSDVLWWVAFALALRCVFEPVVVAYYLWPAVAVALVVAAETWSRLVPAALVATVLTLVSQGAWHGVWTWWAPMTALLALTLLCARIPLPARRPATAASG